MVAGPPNAPLRLGYLTAQYPKVSHTFIRREIRELERRGHTIVRLSIRNGGQVFDPADQDEMARTFVCLDRPKAEILAACAWMQAKRPLRWARATRMALAMSRRSDRGLLTHAAYLAEAALLTRLCEAERVEHLH